MKKLRTLSLAYKIHLPLLFIIIVGLSVIIYNSIIALQGVEERAKNEIKRDLQEYLSNEIAKMETIGLTNAINIALNQTLIESLKQNDRSLALSLLRELSQNYAQYTNFKDIKIHIHDKYHRSFVRDWLPEVYGDNIGLFRPSLHKVVAEKKPIIAVETGRNGMTMRGIAPLISAGEVVGTIEYMQEFDNLALEAKRVKGYDVAVFNCEPKDERIDKFNKREMYIDKDMLLAQSQSVTDQKFYTFLEKNFNKNEIVKRGFLDLDDYFIAGIKLNNIAKEKIGCILIGASRDYVNRYVDEAKENFYKQIWILIGVDLIMLLLLLYLLDRTVKQPIFGLLKGIREINHAIRSGEGMSGLYKEHRLRQYQHDEIGMISTSVNALLRTLSQTFARLEDSNNDRAEYIKAIYAGGLVSISDIEGNITYANDELCRVSGYSYDELIGQPHSIFKDPKTPSRVYEKLWSTILEGNIYNNIMKNVKKNGEYFYANTTIVPIKNSREEIVEFIAFRDDVTELIKSKKELKRTYTNDHLTNLGNRFKMLSDISTDNYLAILDIQFFREVNDFYGYQMGDIVLKDLADRMFRYFDAHKMEVYHLKGDEFAVLAQKSSTSQGEFYRLMQEFLELNSSYEMKIDDDTQITTRLTCGISYEGTNLVTFADMAHKYAKKQNKDIVEYTHNLNIDGEYKKNLEWTKELRRAVKEGRIKAYYQPIVNSKTKKIEKYETLIRLIKSNGEVVSPIHFLEIAKKTRIYKELTKSVVEQAFETFAKNDYDFSINLSAEDVLQHDVGSWLFEKAVEMKVHERLVLEIVESESITSFTQFNDFIKKSKEYGIKIAIDDFGTGYSNFEYLININADYLKIDGSLIKEMDKDEKKYAVVETIVSFAKKNNIKVIAEFVSNREIEERTNQLNIEFNQGHYYGQPQSELV